MMMLALVLTMQAAGTGLPGSAPAIAPCSVAVAAPKRATGGGAGLLIGMCNGRGTALGPADQYSSVASVATGGVLVVRRSAGRQQVLLVSPTQGGAAVDDVTRDLTRLTGRFGDLGLRSDTVDTSRFAIDASVGVTANGTTRWLDLTPYLQAAARLVSDAIQPTTPTTTGN